MTQKEQILEIRQSQQKMAQKQLQMAADLSNFINKQDAFNQKINDLLETNPLTKRKGIVQDLEELKPRVDELEIKNKITAGKITVGIFIFSIIGTVVWKAISLLDKI